MIRRRYAVIFVSACALLLSIGKLRLLAQTIEFEVPAVVDPIHTNGEPDIAIDPSRRVFVSGPNGTGTQLSTWFGSGPWPHFPHHYALAATDRDYRHHC